MKTHSSKNSQRLPSDIDLSELRLQTRDYTLAEKIDFEGMVRDYAGEDQFILGYSDLTGLTKRYRKVPYAITIGLRLDDAIIDGIIDGPTPAYFEHYQQINRRLAEIAAQIQRTIQATIYAATVIDPTTTHRAPESKHAARETLSASFSHKMAATRSGLGWIGKSGLFVSRRFGPRLRLVTVLTNYPLPFGTPVETSLCGDCDICVRLCPGKAATGIPWNPQKKREDFFDAHKCLAACRKLTLERLGQPISICGVCIAVCPVGREG
ncbi:epoxyqueuosine reductase [candidate division KSB1 bacterium]|nr:epoxyqueuosine reductase [candidate division KSB1 bacterium]